MGQSRGCEWIRLGGSAPRNARAAKPTQERQVAPQPEYFSTSVRDLVMSRCGPLFAEPPRWGIPTCSAGSRHVSTAACARSFLRGAESKVSEVILAGAC